MPETIFITDRLRIYICISVHVFPDCKLKSIYFFILFVKMYFHINLSNEKLGQCFAWIITRWFCKGDHIYTKSFLSKCWFNGIKQKVHPRFQLYRQHFISIFHFVTIKYINLKLKIKNKLSKTQYNFIRKLMLNRVYTLYIYIDRYNNFGFKRFISAC